MTHTRLVTVQRPAWAPDVTIRLMDDAARAVAQGKTPPSRCTKFVSRALRQVQDQLDGGQPSETGLIIDVPTTGDSEAADVNSRALVAVRSLSDDTEARQYLGDFLLNIAEATGPGWRLSL